MLGTYISIIGDLSWSAVAFGAPEKSNDPVRGLGGDSLSSISSVFKLFSLLVDEILPSVYKM